MIIRDAIDSCLAAGVVRVRGSCVTGHTRARIVTGHIGTVKWLTSRFNVLDTRMYKTHNEEARFGRRNGTITVRQGRSTGNHRLVG
jgi:hypothetical protein